MAPEALRPLLRTLLARLVRMAIGCGITYQVFSRMLRRVYVEVAKNYEPPGGKPVSDGRISVLTGLSRRDVRAVRAEPPDTEGLRRGLDWHVIDRWSSRAFTDEHGAMRPLHRTKRRGGEQSFEALVAGVSKEVWARALLDEWLRAGKVVLDDEDRVVFVQAASSSADEASNSDAAVLSLAHFMADLLTGFDERFVMARAREGVKFSVLYGHRLTDESAQLICRKAADQAARATADLNRLVLEREALDAGNPAAWRRVTVGIGIVKADLREDPGLLQGPDDGALDQHATSGERTWRLQDQPDASS